jgi:16S rRNA (cytidine1402-2'-O)-methyltransferase
MEGGVSDAASVVQPGTLYVVSTPIGNLGDISQRALDVLRHCDVLLAEDTRHTRILLERHAIRARVEALHEHNEARVVPKLIARLRDAASAALVSDAGTPLVSDPGERLVRAAIDAGVPVVPVPGASAVLAALIASGLPAVPFTFLGFVPRKGAERTAFLQTLGDLTHTAVCFESPERVGQTLAAWVEAGLGGRPLAIARELTKRYEEVRRGTVEELAAYHPSDPVRGEVVLVLGGAPPVVLDEARLDTLAKAFRAEGLSAREVARRLSEEHGAPRNLAYRLAHR